MDGASSEGRKLFELAGADGRVVVPIDGNEKVGQTVKPAHLDSGTPMFVEGKQVEAHHGEVRVASEVGKGSVFTVFLPAYGAES